MTPMSRWAARSLTYNIPLTLQAEAKAHKVGQKATEQALAAQAKAEKEAAEAKARAQEEARIKAEAEEAARCERVERVHPLESVRRRLRACATATCAEQALGLA